MGEHGIAIAAGLLLALVTTPVGVSGAVLLIPVQLSVLGAPSPSVTPTNLLYNVVAVPGSLARFARAGRLTTALTRRLLLGAIPGMILGAAVRVLVLPGESVFRVLVAFLLAAHPAWVLAVAFGAGLVGWGAGVTPVPGWVSHDVPGAISTRAKGRSASTPSKLTCDVGAVASGTTGSSGPSAGGAPEPGTNRKNSLARRVSSATSIGDSLAVMVIADVDSLEDRDGVVGEGGGRAVQRDQVGRDGLAGWVR